MCTKYPKCFKMTDGLSLKIVRFEVDSLQIEQVQDLGLGSAIEGLIGED